jgi:hypothetical protein
MVTTVSPQMLFQRNKEADIPYSLIQFTGSRFYFCFDLDQKERTGKAKTENQFFLNSK